ncbi:MAG: Ig-like domain-containing protein, partial [Candidatus Aminicenantes bacterium]|nr:Ig-like domain-containing protein [Candidatus Aminicenantes bacterium]
INYEDLVGNASTNHSVYKGTSEVSPSLVGDPQVFFLHFLYRGATYQIDTNRYHNLVFKMGISGTQSVSEGSIARVMWRNKNESVENVSEDIIIRHLPDKWVMNKIVCDMNNLPIEAGAGSPSHSGWTGELDSLRIDPHEFPNPRDFFFDDVKLTTDVTANTSLSIEWTLSDSDNTPLVSLYRDNDNTGFNGTLIMANVPVTPGSDSYVADVSAYPEGKYWIYAVVSDGINVNRAYSTGPVLIDHNLTPLINLSKRKIYLGAEQNGPTTSKDKVFITNSGMGALNWQAIPDKSWIGVSPSSGTGNGFTEINIQNTSLAAGPYSGKVTVSDTRASNSPQVLDVFATIYNPGGDSPPFGVLDTPPEGANISGSVAVTGWALDDIEVTQVEIKRDPDVDDLPGSIGSDGLVHIGYALFVKGSRTDVEALYPNYPNSDRSGWGYMLLTFGLPRKGNGTFKLYAFAYDATGHRVPLGTKTIISDNATRIKPFGTIDTPSPGQTISGSAYVNFGWALTPPPKWIPYDGSSLYWSIDSVIQGKVDYGDNRTDIASAFSEYLNANTAGGHKYIDTTQFTNGVHTIGWLAYDSDGVGDGMGSRFFEIQNLGATSAFSSGMEHLKVSQDLSGRLNIEVIGEKEREIDQLGRIELFLKGTGGKEFIGWGADETKPLPLGSTLDKENGIFYWMPGPGFLNQQILHFAVTDGISKSKPERVIINITPKKAVQKKINNHRK